MVSIVFISVEFVFVLTYETMNSVISFLFVSVEFVLAITGATMGSMISFIFPAIMFISVMSISQSKFVAQVRHLHRALCRINYCQSHVLVCQSHVLVCQSHVLVDTLMLTVKLVYKLSNCAW